MATWEDGPEYAPVERPADFAVPSPSAAQPPALEAPTPVISVAASAPKERPAFEVPPTPVVELARLVPAVADERDPAQAFDVASSTVTSMDSAWGAAHWSPPNGPVAPAAGSNTVDVIAVGGQAVGSIAGGPWPAPSPPVGPVAQPWNAAPPPYNWPAPTAPIPPAAGSAQYPGGFPPPGTPQWFGPGPPQVQQPPTVVEHDARAVLEAATPGLCICLAVGGLTSLFAPAMLVVCYFLATRVRVAQKQVRGVMIGGLGGLVFFAFVGYLWYGTADGVWWAFLGGWGQVLCWLLLITVLVLVRRALKRRSGRPPGYPPTWR